MNRIKLKFFIPWILCFITEFIAASSPVVIPEVNLNNTENAPTKNNEEQAQTTKISRKKIEDSPNVLLSDLLKQEQSIVRIINNTNDNSQVVMSIRGFGDNAFANSLIVIDGFPFTNPSVLAPSFNAISLSDIQGIEIIQGSEGSLWGDQAVGGVVKISTIHPEKPLLDGIVSYGSYDKQVFNLLLGDKFANGLFFKLLGFSNSTDNYREHNQQTDEGINSQLGLDYSSGSLTLNAKIYDDKIELPGGLTQQQYNTDPSQASNFSNFSHFQTQIYQLIQKQTLGDNWLLETRLGHNTINGDGFISSDYTRQDQQDTLNPVLSGTLFSSKLLLGYEGQLSSFQLIGSVKQQADIGENDVYAQTIIPIFPRLDLTLGARSAWQKDDITPSGALTSNQVNNQVLVSEQGLAYHLNTNWEFFLRRDGNFRFPKANELTTLPQDLGPLQPQTGVSYELGSKWHSLRQTAQVSLYRLQLQNEIAYDPTQTAAAPFGSYSNFPETLRQGITLTELYHLTGKILLDGQFNYVDARFAAGVDEDNQIPAVPAINGNLGIGYGFRPHWQAKYTAIYTGSRYPSQDVDNVGSKLPSYWLSNIALQFLRKSTNLSFQVENIFNQRYPLFTVYTPSTQTNTFYPGAGRNFLLTAKVFLD